MAAKTNHRCPLEQAVEEELAVLIGHCPCGGKLAVEAVVKPFNRPWVTRYRCPACYRLFAEKRQAIHAR